MKKSSFTEEQVVYALSLEEARQVIEAWRMDYNTVRPHRSFEAADAGGRLGPMEAAHRGGTLTFGMDQKTGAGHLPEDSHNCWTSFRGHAKQSNACSKAIPGDTSCFGPPHPCGISVP